MEPGWFQVTLKLFLWHEGRYLALRDSHSGFGDLPGGRIGRDESVNLPAALEREVAEETGLLVRAHYLAEVFERIMHDAEGRAEYHYVLADYVCRVRKDGPAVPQAGDDAGSVAWVRIEDLGSVLLTEGTKEVVERVYAKHKRRNARI